MWGAMTEMLLGKLCFYDFLQRQHTVVEELRLQASTASALARVEIFVGAVGAAVVAEAVVVLVLPLGVVVEVRLSCMEMTMFLLNTLEMRSADPL